MATDFTEPPTPIDGRYRVVLTVRDLASGCTLAAMPCITDNATAVTAVLVVLFAEHGAPLVIKADNGPAFIGRTVSVWPRPSADQGVEFACRAGGDRRWSQGCEVLFPSPAVRPSNHGASASAIFGKTAPGDVQGGRHDARLNDRLTSSSAMKSALRPRKGDAIRAATRVAKRH